MKRFVLMQEMRTDVANSLNFKRLMNQNIYNFDIDSPTFDSPDPWDKSCLHLSPLPRVQEHVTQWCMALVMQTGF